MDELNENDCKFVIIVDMNDQYSLEMFHCLFLYQLCFSKRKKLEVPKARKHELMMSVYMTPTSVLRALVFVFC